MSDGMKVGHTKESKIDQTGGGKTGVGGRDDKVATNWHVYRLQALNRAVFDCHLSNSFGISGMHKDWIEIRSL